MASKRKSISFLDFHCTAGQIQIKELRQHGKYFCIAHQFHLRIFLRNLLDIACMIRLHMIDNQIIRLSVSYCFFHFGKPFIGYSRICRIHDGDLFIHNHIGIVGYSIWNMILALKQINPSVVAAHIEN